MSRLSDIFSKICSLIVFLLLALVYLVYTPWSMYQAFPLAESLMHLNSESVVEAWQVAVVSWREWTPRLGEFLSYFFIYKPFVCIAVQHAIGMVLLLVMIYRFSTGRYPDGGLKSALLLLYVTLLLQFISPNVMWWIDAMNWIYPMVLFLYFFIECELLSGDAKIGTAKFVFLIVICVCASMSNEVLAVGLLPCYLSVLVLNWLYHKGSIMNSMQVKVALAIALSSVVFIFVSLTGIRTNLVAGYDLGTNVINTLLSFKKWGSVFLFFPHLTVLVAVSSITYAVVMRKRIWRCKEYKLYKLVLLAFIVYCVSVVMPGYSPHREYRVFQVLLICWSLFCMQKVISLKYGCAWYTLIFLLSMYVGWNQNQRQIEHVIFQRNIWSSLHEEVIQRKNEHGIAEFSAEEIDAIFEKYRKEWTGELNVLSFQYLVRAQKLVTGEFRHIYADHNFKPNTDPFVRKTIRNKMLANPDSDLLLNRCVAERLGVKGVVVYGDGL